MRGFMFRNPWMVALFAGITLIGVAALVGSEDHKGALSSVADSRGDPPVAETPSAADAAGAAQHDTAEPAADTTEFADDSDLIDTGEGFDPTPADPASDTADEVVPGDDAANVDPDVGASGQ